ncbi:negative elongation factor C/D [Paragonimus westermani]|uniref:Negative elongation factor C/D n=1 Tax=Paragonimus westermani TaxID=34504 RepID=A0A5J4P288_9TREM|nr:negative elongation factor C/D [Paragonimus westermani]
MTEDYKAALYKKDAILEHPSMLANAIDSIRRNEVDGASEAEKILVENYHGAIEFLFELGTWLTYIDEDAQSTRNIIEAVVKEAILQNYDRSKAITCLTDDALADTMEWLSQMVESPTWRQTIYELAQHPRNEDCPFLSLAMPCIAVKDDLIGELISVPLAWNTLEIFLKCVAHVLQPLLAAGETVHDGLLMHSVAFLQPMRSTATESSGQTVKDVPLSNEISEFCSPSTNQLCRPSIPQLSSASEKTADMLSHFLEMGCHSEHGYLILQSILQCLASRTKGYAARHLSWLLEAEASRRNRDTSRYSVYFCGARDYPESMDAMRTLLRHQELVPECVQQLYEEYKKDASPPVRLLRQPIFIALLADALFASSDRLLAEQQEQYAYLYSYTAMTVEAIEPDTDRRLSSERTHVEDAKREVLEASRICRQWNNMSGSANSLRAFRDLPALLKCLSCRPVSFGVFRFVRVAFRTKRVDFELNLDTMKPYCIVVNELAEVNEHLHPALLAFITELLSSSVEGMEDLSQLEYKRMLVGLLVHLLYCGHVVPVVRTMHRLFTRNRVDVSIARHFVTEVGHIGDSLVSQLMLVALADV